MWVGGGEGRDGGRWRKEGRGKRAVQWCSKAMLTVLLLMKTFDSDWNSITHWSKLWTCHFIYILIVEWPFISQAIQYTEAVGYVFCAHDYNVWWFCILYSTASYSLFLAWWIWRSFHLSLFSIGVLVAASPSACSRFRQTYSLSEPGVEQGWHLESTQLEAFTWCQCPWDTHKHYWGKFSIELHLHTVCTLGQWFGDETLVCHMIV